MNKKLAIVIAVFVLLIILGGGYLLLHKSSSSKPESAQSIPTQSKTVFNSITDALMKNLSLKCDYTTGTVHTIAYIKNGMVRSDVTDSKDTTMSGSVIIKDKKIYYWTAQKIGFMMVMPEISVTPPAGSTGSSDKGQNTLQNLEQYRQYCHVATVADGLFVSPADIKFTDETQMMQKVSVTVGPTGASGNYQQQVQQYMQQYHITPQQ